ncbi:hypothetical protein [Tolypothrix sp. VBCCA 56010]|uniref:hypothetical protein n=1 Tax=Tolypothrix sp. VBCCA 56010 TaxID=3137731 RepID=UPI003D7CD9C5
MISELFADELPAIPPRQPWDMLVGEDGWSYSLFLKYLQLPPGQRSVARVAQMVGRTKRNAEYFSSRHRWVQRARLFDEHILSKELKENA